MYRKKGGNRGGSKSRVGRTANLRALYNLGSSAYHSYFHNSGSKRKVAVGHASTTRKKYKSGSISMTKTGKKKIDEDVGQHNILERTKDSIKIHKWCRFRASVGRWKYVDQATSIFTGAEGMQLASDVGYFMLPANFSSATTTPSTSTQKLVVGNGFFNMNPYQKTTGGAATGNSAITLSDDRIVVEKVDIKYGFLNMTNISMEVDVYVLTPRMISPYYGPQASWDGALGAQGLSYGALVQSNATKTAGYPTSSFYAQKPEDNAGFNKEWKILKKRCLKLNPGATINYDLILHYAQTFDRFTEGQAVSQGVAGSGAVKSSVYVMIVQRGSLCKDTGGTVTYAPTELGVVYTAEYYLRAPRQGPNRTQSIYAVPVFQTGGASATIINDVDVSANVLQL